MTIPPPLFPMRIRDTLRIGPTLSTFESITEFLNGGTRAWAIIGATDHDLTNHTSVPLIATLQTKSPFMFTL